MSSESAPPLKVCHVIHSRGKGGAELALLRSLRSQPPWDPAVAVPDDTLPTDAFGGDQLTTIPYRSSSKPGAATATFRSSLLIVWNIAMSALSLRRNAIYRSADIVHANTTRAAVICGLARLGRKNSTPLVVHLRDETSREALGRFGFFAFRRVLRSADGVIANSRFSLSSAAPFLATSAQSVVIPSPIGAIVPTARSRDHVIRFGLVARIDEWKGHELLLRAFATAFADDPSVELHLAGAPQFGELELLLRLQSLAQSLTIAGQVKFRGHVSDIQNFLDEIDVGVQCSTRPEPLGQNVLQYIAAGCGVIVSNEGGPVEWITSGVNGLAFTPRSVESLANSLANFRTNPGLIAKFQDKAVPVPSVEDVNAAMHAFFRAVHQRVVMKAGA